MALALPGGAAAVYEVKLCADGANGDGVQITTAPGTTHLEILDQCHNPAPNFHSFTENTIGQEGNLVDGSVEFLLQAPAGTKIARFFGTRESTATGGWDLGTVWEASRGAGPLLERIAEPTAGGGVNWEVDSTMLAIRLLCPEHNCLLPKFGGHSIVRMNNMTAVFEDLLAPAVAFGALPSAPVHGTIGVPLTAADQGSGITNVEVLADGAAIGSVFDSNEGRCAVPYKFVVPCKLQLGGSVGLDTTKLQEGPHAVRAVVTDASGLQAEATATIEVRNRPENTGRPKLSGAAVRHSALSGTHGEWDGLPPTYAFQWLRCEPAVKPNDEAGCAPIAGASADTYTAEAADVGKRLIIKVTATNPAGTRSALSAPSEIVAAGAPELSGVKLTRQRFRVGSKPTAVKARPKPARGTVLRFSSSEAGRLTVKIAPAKNQKGKAKLKPRTLTRKIKAGPGRLAFSGRIRRKPLRPGRYLMTVSMADADGNASARAKLRFTILPG